MAAVSWRPCASREPGDPRPVAAGHPGGLRAGHRRLPAVSLRRPGWGRRGEAQACAGGDGLELVFPPEGITIPLDGRTTTVLGLPLPPGLSISIVPQALTGQLQTTSGELQLWFRAAFRFRIRVGRLWQLAPPDLSVEAQLSSGGCRSLRHQRQGEARNGHGNTTVAGVATVPPAAPPGSIASWAYPMRPWRCCAAG